MSKEVTKLKEALNSLSQLSYSASSSKRQSQQLEALQQHVKQLQNQLAVSGLISTVGTGWRTRPTTQLITCPASRADRSDGHKHLSILQLRSWELWTQLFWGRRRKLSDMRRDVLCREAAHRKPGGSLHPLYSRPFLCSTHFYLWQ